MEWNGMEGMEEWNDLTRNGTPTEGGEWNGMDRTDLPMNGPTWNQLIMLFQSNLLRTSHC